MFLSDLVLFLATLFWSIMTRITTIGLQRKQSNRFLEAFLNCPIFLNIIFLFLNNMSTTVDKSMILYLNMLAFAGVYDFKTMMIPRTCSLWAIPAWITLSYFGMTTTTWQESLIGAALLYGMFWIVAKIFKQISGRDGMGEGDMELVGMIGSYLGPKAGLMAVNIGTLITFATVLAIKLFKGKNVTSTKFPFGPGLALGGIIVAIGQLLQIL